MTGVPNEEKPIPLVPDSYLPPEGVRHSVSKGETWITVARGLGIDPWDLIDFNFPGIKRTKMANPQRATRQVNWYLREYVGCQTSTDKENWAFDTGLTKGRGSWKGGVIYLPPKASPLPQIPKPRCSPTTSGKIGRRPTFYRPLTPAERAVVFRVFDHTLPNLDTVGIGDELGFDGRPWTDMTPMTEPGMPQQMQFELNLGDAAREDLSSKAFLTSCYVKDIPGTVSDLLVHEMTHVWQYHNRQGLTARFGVWISSLAGDYNYTAGNPWASYDVEQQASIVEKWYHDGEQKTHQLYPYVRLVVRSANSKDALRYASDLTLNELNRDIADLRARKLD